MLEELETAPPRYARTNRARPASPPSASLTDLNVMIVDDSAPMRRLLRRALTSMGVRGVREAGCAGDALEQLSIAPADVLLLDFAMPSMTGPEFLHALDGSAGHAARPAYVVMISGYEDRRAHDEARDAGVDAFVSKPISMAALVSRLEAAVGSSLSRAL